MLSAQKGIKEGAFFRPAILPPYSLRKLGQGFCVPPFQVVCLYQTKLNDEDSITIYMPKTRIL